MNPAGKLGGRPPPKGQEFTYTVMAQGRFNRPKSLGNHRPIKPRRLHSSLEGRGPHRNGRTELRHHQPLQRQGDRGLAIYQLPGSNAVQTAKNVTAHLDELEKRFPKDLASGHDPRHDQGCDPRHERNQPSRLLEALMLVVLVVYVFLQGWRATFIPLAGSSGVVDWHVHDLPAYWDFQ
ncbi:MAG: efflux RND transporter permease subunit [Paludibaculum sp.]